MRIVVRDGQKYFTTSHTEERSEWRLVSYLYVIPALARVQYEETVWDIEPGQVPVVSQPNPGER